MVKCPKGTPEQINANLSYFKQQIEDRCYSEVEEESVGGEYYATLNAELDVVRADERHPPATQDEITYLFFNHFLDIILKSWDGKPCLKPKLGRPVDDVSDEKEEEKEKEDEKEKEKSLPEEDLEKPQSSGLSGENLLNLYNSRFEIMSKDNIPDRATIEERLSAICKKRCESESEVIGEEEATSENEYPWKTVVPDENVYMSFINGAWYTGRVSRRLMDGNGTFFWEDGGSFQGEFISGAATGFGRLQFPNLNIYEGTVYQGHRHGEGLYYKFDSPVMYSGEWWLGKKNGSGVLFYDDPVLSYNFYKGSWRNGKKEGFGYREYPSGSKYIGFWQNGKRHGKGIMFWCNHDIYKGEWKNGLMDGFGEYVWNGFINKTFSSPRVNAYKGQWSNGKRNGFGSLEIRNGSFIETVWVDNMKNGPGAVICPNGLLVMSTTELFKNDKPALLGEDGEGLLGLFFRNDEFQINRKKNYRKEILKGPDESQLLNFMKSMEKSKAISIPIHTPVHSLDLGCHLKRLADQKKESLSKVICIIAITADEKTPVKKGKTPEKIRSTESLNEEKLLRYSIMINLIRLKECYEVWSTAACSVKPPFPCILMRIFFWQMLIQSEVPRRNLSLVDIDELLFREENFLVDCAHDPFEKIQFWQFIHFLITISWYLYGRYVNLDNPSPPHKRVEEFLKDFYNQNEKGILAGAFNYFLQNHIFFFSENVSGMKDFENINLVPLEAMYKLYKKIGEPHSAEAFLNAVLSKNDGVQEDSPLNRIYIEKIPDYMKSGVNAMFVNELYYLPVEDPFNHPTLLRMEKQMKESKISELSCFAELGLKEIVQNLVLECPLIMEDELIVDMEYELTFLEFYRAVIKCSKALLRKRELKKIEEEIMSNYKKELEQYEKLMKEYEKQKEAFLANNRSLNVKKPKK